MTLLEVEINEAKQKRNKAERELKAAIEQEKPADIRADLRALYEGTVSELNCLVQKKVELMKEKQLHIRTFSSQEHEETNKRLTKQEEENTNLKKRIRKLEETVRNYMQSAATVQISNLNHETLQKDGYVCLASTVQTPESIDFEDPGKFEWPVPTNEEDESNSDAYLEYLQTIASEFEQLKVRKTIDPPFLNTTVGINPHPLKGNADLYVVPSSCSLICRNQLAMVFELKRNTITPNNLAEAIGNVIAADSLFDVDHRPAPVGVLSDFADQWILIWIDIEGIICFCGREINPEGETMDLTRKTAIYYIRRHLSHYRQLIEADYAGSCKTKQEDIHEAFGFFDSGHLKKYRMSVGDAQSIEKS